MEAGGAGGGGQRVGGGRSLKRDQRTTCFLHGRVCTDSAWSFKEYDYIVHLRAYESACDREHATDIMHLSFTGSA